jgi:hypothetical protein
VAVQNIHDLAPFLFRDDVEKVVVQVLVDSQARLLVIGAMTAQTMLREEGDDGLAVSRLVRFESRRCLGQAEARRHDQDGDRAATTQSRRLR